ncbi:MAG: S-layer homology domain-containing protein [Vallitaleaceae bacterium]|nr:S-layer homology domain-containing protein [Vallitaleaceae bacterium]
MTAEGVWTQVWMKQEGDTEFIKIHDSFFANEYILIDADDYFSKSQDSYEEEAYEIKIRYSLDLRKYPQANRTDMIYSPFSNVLSQNMPAWSNAHPWAEGELLLADEANLIPEVLRGQDLTRPITREEFAELAVLLYETTTGKSAIAASPNPFTDTTNPQVLKAYQLGITTGTSATTFAPNVLINREQCATMLFRDIQAIVPEGDFSVIGVADFADQKFISAYAVAATKFMSQLGIIKGDSAGNFMPKSTTAAQTAANYGMATREQAIMMSYRIFSEYK